MQNDKGALIPRKIFPVMYGTNAARYVLIYAP